MADLIKRLEAFGFTNYESKVFMVLMKGHNMTAAEVAEEAKIPRTSVYDILKSFAEKGICNEIQTPSKLRYEMIDPDVVQDKLEKELDRNYKKRLTDLKSSFDELKPLFKVAAAPDHMQDVELLRGFNKQREVKLLDLIKNTKEEMLLMTRLQGKGGNIDEEQDEESERILKNKGTIKTIYSLSPDFKLKEKGTWVDVDANKFVEFCESAEKGGVEIRIAKNIPQYLMVFDRMNVFFSLNVQSAEKHNRSDIIVKNKDFAEVMVHTFNSYWEESMTVKDFKKTLK